MMKPEDAQRDRKALEVFGRAVEMAGAEARAACLEGGCGGDAALKVRVEVLLANHVEDSFLQTPAASLGPGGTAIVPITEKPGDRIGRYKLLEQIGEGGCGTVYMAEQEAPVRRRVALKVIKLGMDTRQVVARFEAERQALALMDHPNIAKVFDGGATGAPLEALASSRLVGQDAAGKMPALPAEGPADSKLSTTHPQLPTGRPYFVMELVRGLRITDYCEQHNLSTRERLDLFMQVCSAIQHAHQKGIIHRDIKPSNVLVTENDGKPVPKVIDFGIAKATEQKLTDKTLFTQFAQFIGTPAYMSPEQSALTSVDIDTRSDIYSLGVLLYELLTGTTPFDAQELLKSGFDEMRRIIQVTEPEKPSTRLTQRLGRGDAIGVGSTGYQPVPSGDSPDGTGRAPQSKASGRVPEARPVVPVGGSPTETGESPVPPISSGRLAQRKALIHQLRGDLDWIVMKCLEKDRARRYETATGLAADIQRHLDNETVLARPASTAYRFRKLVRRNKRAFAAATALAGVLVLGAVVSIWQAVRATRAEREQSGLREKAQTAQKEAERAQQAETQERRRAEKGELAARTSELAARQFAYASDMNLAHQAVQEDDFYRALQLLDRHRPATNPLRSSRREEAHFQPGTQNSELGTSQSLLTSATTDLRGWEWRYLWRQCQGEERFILGEHTNGATAVGLLADGKTVFSAGKDKMVRLWDLESRRQIGLLPHAEEVIGAAASPDGRWLATTSMKAGEGQPVLLWDLATQKIAAPLSTVTTNFTNLWLRPGSITFSSDNKWLAFATVFRGVRLWDVKARSEVTNLKALDGSAGRIGLAFSPDSRTLAYNEDEHGAILLWDMADRSIDRLAGHHDVVRSLAFSPDGQMLASGSQDKTARLWNLAERRARIEFTNHSGGCTSVAFSPNGRTLAMSGEGGAGRIIRLVDVETGNQKAELRGHLKDISSLAFTPDGQLLLSAGDDRTVRVWDPVPRAKEKSAHLFTRNSISLAWRSYGPALCLSPDGRHLLTVHTNQTFSLWDTLRLAEGKRHPLPFTNTTIAVVAPGGRLAAFGSRGGEVMLWDAETGRARSFAQPGTNRVHLLVFSLDGRYLAAADDTKTLSQMAAVNDTRRTVRVWDVSAQKETHVFSTDGEFPVSLTFSADARALLTGTFTGSVKLWPLDSALRTPHSALSEAATFLGHSGGVDGLAMLPNGETLISAGTDIRFWDVRTRIETDKLSPRAGSFSCVALSPDGRRFAAGASDGRITIWDVASHQELATLDGHEESVRQLAFTPDGDRLVSASKDQLRVWHAASRSEADAATEQEARK